MRTIVAFLILIIHQLCIASDDIDIIATSEWSKPVKTIEGDSLRARTIVAYGRGVGFSGQWPETQFYLEFQNVSTDSEAPIHFYFNPQKNLRCVMQDASGKTPSQAGGGSGGGPGAAWITLPYDSTIRLRANMFGYGKKPGDGLLLCLWPSQYWNIPAGETNAYFLSGTFTITKPINHVNTDGIRTIWSGSLELPKMKISVPIPRNEIGVTNDGSAKNH